MTSTSISKRIAILKGHLSRNVSTDGTSEKHYDVLVIGGGSGGVACAKEAGKLGARVCLLDYVTPTPRGATWGLGGTCVNVGCIPKKLMHKAALLGEDVKSSPSYGWNIPNGPELSHDWAVLVKRVQDYIHSLSWGHRVQLRDRQVDYFSGEGSFKDKNTVEVIAKDGTSKAITADTIVVAVGLRPRYPDIPGAIEYGITSDDLFSLHSSPGRTLIVGGSYVALECAGFLNGLDISVTLMIRSIPLRRFDQQMAHLVLDNLIDSGVDVRMGSVPVRVDKLGEELSVNWRTTDSDRIYSETFNTVLFATGREPRLDRLQLDKAGVRTDDVSHKIIVQEDERTTVPNIYALGDVAMDRPELTPVAIRAGKLLARRLYGESGSLVDYSMVPITVFTPLEYSCVGLGEEEAREKHGEDHIQVYHAYFTPLEYALPQRSAKQCYVKVICTLPEENVIGLHFTGPNAGEVLQGFAVSMRCGLQWADLEQTIGIHPTCAEEFVKLHITKRSGENPVITGC